MSFIAGDNEQNATVDSYGMGQTIPLEATPVAFNSRPNDKKVEIEVLLCKDNLIRFKCLVKRFFGDLRYVSVIVAPRIS